MRKIIILLLSCCLAGCLSQNHHAGRHDHPHFTKHYEKSLFQKTSGEQFSVEMVLPAEGFTVGNNTVDLIFHNRRDEDVAQAVVSVAQSMDMPGHSNMPISTIIERGGGLYTVDNLNLPMAGQWNLLVKINKNGVMGETTFPITVHNKGESAGMNEHSNLDPTTLNVSTTVHSLNNLFEVSYHPMVQKITLNTMHAWKVTVKNQAGMPVTGAKFTISGGMPAHGHGLPTKPAMTKELGNGVYLIEGLRFSMPGVWTIHFDISTADNHDTAQFNLLL